MNKTFWLILMTAFLGMLACWALFSPEKELESMEELDHHHFVVARAYHLSGVPLADPEQAPKDVLESVMRGYRIMLNTQKLAPDYVGDKLSCTNCHFCGGDTLGGKDNGISLVGVTAVYPKFSSRDNKEIKLADRINNCFMRSMNGKPLPDSSPIMEDILAYLTWISKEVAHYKRKPWLGLQYLKSQHKPDPEAGSKVYQKYCSMCHQNEGAGEDHGILLDIPPLWGEYSFNDGAGMSMMSMLSAFIYWNMPKNDAFLTEEEALDVSAFMLKQPRPRFIKPDK